MTTIKTPLGVEILAPVSKLQREILTPEALSFFADLHREFNTRRLELLHERQLRQRDLDAGELPTFLPETRHIRDAAWEVDPVPAWAACRSTI